MDFFTKRKKILFLGAVVAIVVLLCSVAMVNTFVLQQAKPFIYHQTSDVPTEYTVLVLGARVYQNDGMSAMLGDRMLTALDLYHQGKVKRFLLSGDHGRKEYDEVNTMKDFLLKQGVPAEDIFLDHAGFDTYDSLYRAKNIFRVNSVVIVTQEFHLPRAIFIAKALRLDVVGVVADQQLYAGVLRNQLREVLARVKAYLDVTFHVLPTYLGEEIPITGDSSKSWD